MDSSASRTIRASEVFGLAVVSCLLLAASTAPAHTIVVPADQPTIQQAVWASSEGDTVLVMPGTYVENIVIDRDIAVRSAEGPAVTIIDGSQPANPDSASVVSFRSYADGSIEGFDIRNGTGRSAGSQRQGGGILVNNWFEPSIVYGPLIMGNWIHGNWLDGDITDRGAGVEVVGAARILNNRLYDNGFIADGYGAALSVTREWGGHQEPVVFQANEVFDNHGYPAVPGRNSGAVRIMDTVCTENVIACNSGGRGAALIGGGQITSNTIAGNWSFTQEAAVLLGMRADAANCWSVLFQNNNVTDNVGPGVECLYCDTVVIDLLCNNISGNFPGGQVIGECGDVIGHDGNISVVPLYGRIGCEPGYDYWCLSENSPLLIDPPPGCGLIGALGLCPPIGIRDTKPVAPRHLQVSTPRPNPFTSRTTIPFYLAKDSEVEVQIYNVLGRKLRTLHTDWLLTGDHVLEWDGRIETGDRAASGAYVARIRAGGEELTRTLLLVR